MAKKKSLMDALSEYQASNEFGRAQMKKEAGSKTKKIGMSVADLRKKQAKAKQSKQGSKTQVAKNNKPTQEKPTPKPAVGRNQGNNNKRTPQTNRNRSQTPPKVRKGSDIFSRNVGSDGRRGAGMPSNPPGMRQTRAGGSKPAPKRPTRKSRYSSGQGTMVKKRAAARRAGRGSRYSGGN